MNRVRLFRSAVLIFVLLAFTVVGQAQDEPAIPEVTITASEDGVALPEDLSAGLTTITFDNQTEDDYSPLLLRVNEGATLEDFLSNMDSDPATALTYVSILGSLDTAAGESHSVTYDLSAGDYAFMNFGSDTPDINTFTVAESSDESAPAPEADVQVTMVDFAYAIPDTLASGPQVWELHNEGQQPHEMGIFKVDDDATLEDVQSTLMNMMMSEDENAEFPYESAMFWTPMGPDAQAWIDVDLEPGTYVATCFLPDFLGDMTPHMMHGMIKLFKVAE